MTVSGIHPSQSLCNGNQRSTFQRHCSPAGRTVAASLTGIDNARMRVLVISAHSGAGLRQGKSFLGLLRETLDSMAGLLGGKPEITIRKLSELAEIVPPTPVPGAPANEVVVRLLCAFDSIDMIFLEGGDNLAPWARASEHLLRVFHLCIASGKPLLGSGCATNMLSYLANIGPMPITVRSGTLSNFEPPSDGSARIDKRTGDLFYWSPEGGLWVPVGNVGSRCATQHDANAGDIRKPSQRNYSDGVRTCELLITSSRHWLFHGIGQSKFAVYQRNDWSVRMPQGGTSVLTPTGAYTVRPLAVSELGVQVLECRHVVALAFQVSAAAPESVAMLRNFIEHKTMLMRGEVQGDAPRRIYEMWTREPAHSDLMQQLYNSLAMMKVRLPTQAIMRDPPRAHPPARPQSAHCLSQPAFLTQGIKDESGVAEPPTAPAARRPASALAVALAGTAPPSLAQPRTRRHASSAPSVAGRTGPGSSSPAGSRPESARSFASAGTRITVGSICWSTGSAASCSASSSSHLAGYVVSPSAALVYLDESTRALSARGSNLTHAARGRAEIHAQGGGAQEMTFYKSKPKVRPSSSARRKPGSDASPRVAGSGPEDVPASGAIVPAAWAAEPSLTFQIEQPEIGMVDGPMPCFPESEIEARIRKIRERRKRDESAPVARTDTGANLLFSSWQKHRHSDSTNGKIERSNTFVTSSGPYYSSKEEHASGGLISTTSDVRRMAENAAIAKALQIHARLPIPPTRMGLAEHMNRDAKDYDGFAATGFNVPAAYQSKSGSFFNTSMVRFRDASPKMNVYM